MTQHTGEYVYIYTNITARARLGRHAIGIFDIIQNAGPATPRRSYICQQYTACTHPRVDP